jgi:hypothetical protein
MAEVVNDPNVQDAWKGMRGLSSTQLHILPCAVMTAGHQLRSHVYSILRCSNTQNTRLCLILPC